MFFPPFQVFLNFFVPGIMPPYELETMTSWADRVELEEQTEGDLPAPTEHFDERKGIKTITEYKFNEDNKKVKIVRTFKIEKRKVAKSIATRKVRRGGGGR